MEHRFGPGDVLLTYTDGLIEARDEAGEQFGFDRMLAALQDTGPDDSLDLILERLFTAVRAFTGTRATDDTALLACRVAVPVRARDEPSPRIPWAGPT